MIALFLFVFYSNMISVLQASVMRGKVSFMLGWWPMHLLALVAIATMFLWRLKMNSPYHPLVMWGAAKRAYLIRKAGAQ